MLISHPLYGRRGSRQPLLQSRNAIKGVCLGPYLSALSPKVRTASRYVLLAFAPGLFTARQMENRQISNMPSAA